MKKAFSFHNVTNLEVAIGIFFLMLFATPLQTYADTEIPVEIDDENEGTDDSGDMKPIKTVCQIPYVVYCSNNHMVISNLRSGSEIGISITDSADNVILNDTLLSIDGKAYLDVEWLDRNSSYTLYITVGGVKWKGYFYKE